MISSSQRMFLGPLEALARWLSGSQVAVVNAKSNMVIDPNPEPDNLYSGWTGIYYIGEPFQESEKAILLAAREWRSAGQVGPDHWETTWLQALHWRKEFNIDAWTSARDFTDITDAHRLVAMMKANNTVYLLFHPDGVGQAIQEALREFTKLTRSFPTYCPAGGKTGFPQSLFYVKDP